MGQAALPGTEEGDMGQQGIETTDRPRWDGHGGPTGRALLPTRLFRCC
jgi:hypothetical protein